MFILRLKPYHPMNKGFYQRMLSLKNRFVLIKWGFLGFFCNKMCFFNKSILSFFQNETLSPNEEEGILINEFSLVLQNVGHHSIGKYMCMATNDAGKGSSQQVFLDVKCKQYG